MSRNLIPRVRIIRSHIEALLAHSIEAGILLAETSTPEAQAVNAKLRESICEIEEALGPAAPEVEAVV